MQMRRQDLRLVAVGPRTYGARTIAVAVGGVNSPNFNTCNQNLTTHRCSTAAADGFGMVSDTIGDYSGAPGLGPGEAFNMQLAIKVIF